MKNFKKVIIILLVLIAIISICILIIKKRSQEGNEWQREVDQSADFIKDMGIVSDNGTFFSVEKMLDNYIGKVASENKEATYSLLDDTYIKKNNITKENVLNQIPSNIKDIDNMRITKMYGQTNMENEVYYIECVLEKDGKIEDGYFVLYKDIRNMTYSVSHIKENYTKESLAKKTIEKNEYNKMINEVLSEEEIANKYFKDFLENAVYNVEATYSMLDKEYKSKRFPTLQDFEEYIDGKKDLYTAAVTQKGNDDFDNMEDYILYISKKQQLKLQSYQIRYEDDYTRYICKDSYNNYYIFNATSPLNYTVMLDTYTIDLPDFIEKYEAGTKEEKVGYNILKLVEALNCSDYEYIYSKLSDDFKANYFKEYKDFEKYAKETFSIKNEVSFKRYTESENLSTYEITVKGISKTVTKTIVMKLEKGTDFVMAFNVE